MSITKLFAATLLIILLPLEVFAVKQQLLAAVPAHFPPHYIVDDKGEVGGFAVEIMDIVARDLGVEIEYIPKNTWIEVHDALSNGEVNLIPNMGITPSRQKHFDFTSPVEVFSVVVFLRSTTEDIPNLKGLSGKKVGTVHLNVAAKILQKRNDIELIKYDLPEKAIFALLAGEIDAFAYPEPVVWKLARDVGIEDHLKV
ncbi:MAG: transporter substrate-binding domain-containing protein, partial [Sulfurimonadaceae bacterium]|nr:transporter substrate-binding domain-containing protein [Sulfurimonadaceae bacterium]